MYAFLSFFILFFFSFFLFPSISFYVFSFFLSLSLLFTFFSFSVFHFFSFFLSLFLFLFLFYFYFSSLFSSFSVYLFFSLSFSFFQTKKWKSSSYHHLTFWWFYLKFRQVNPPRWRMRLLERDQIIFKIQGFNFALWNCFCWIRIDTNSLLWYNNCSLDKFVLNANSYFGAYHLPGIYVID